MDELSALIQATLGHPLDGKTFEELAAIQNRLHQTQDLLAAKLEDGSLSPEDYLANLNNALIQTNDECLKVLGPGRFAAIFGFAGDHPEEMIDEEIFLEDQERRRARR